MIDGLPFVVAVIFGVVLCAIILMAGLGGLK